MIHTIVTMTLSIAVYHSVRFKHSKEHMSIVYESPGYATGRFYRRCIAPAELYTSKVYVRLWFFTVNPVTTNSPRNTDRPHVL